MTAAPRPPEAAVDLQPISALVEDIQAHRTAATRALAEAWRAYMAGDAVTTANYHQQARQLHDHRMDLEREYTERTGCQP